MQYTDVLFDLDGTLTESGIGVVNCFKYALEKLGVTSYDSSLLNHVVGPPLLYSFTQLFGMTMSQAKRGVELYRQRYVPIGIYENSLYLGVYDMLSALKNAGIRIHLATSKPSMYVPEILSQFNILNYFGVLGAASDADGIFTKEDVIAYVLSCLKGVAKSQILMVGDTEFDLNAAAKIGIDAAGVLYGYGEKATLTACKNIGLFESTKTLTQFILK